MSHLTKSQAWRSSPRNRAVSVALSSILWGRGRWSVPEIGTSNAANQPRCVNVSAVLVDVILYAGGLLGGSVSVGEQWHQSSDGGCPGQWHHPKGGSRGKAARERRSAL